jgi:hypothetical protein
MICCAPCFNFNHEQACTLLRSRLATSRPLASRLVDHPHIGSHVYAIDDFTAPHTQITDHAVNAGDLVDF